MSRVHWTPLIVAKRVCELAHFTASDRVLDVGSGVGKFCIASALLTPADFTGIDHNRDCVIAANEIASQLALTNASFIHADATSISWNDFTTLYFFNPFGESDEPDDRSRHDTFTARTLDRLASLRVGTRVVVYFDVGTPLPDAFELTHHEELAGHTLSLFIKR